MMPTTPAIAALMTTTAMMTDVTRAAANKAPIASGSMTIGNDR
ncbi:Uncharacterised protein [Raoultella planticola]|nr:Uncharacterised protein [Raoultella planticola]